MVASPNMELAFSRKSGNFLHAQLHRIADPQQMHTQDTRLTCLYVHELRSMQKRIDTHLNKGQVNEPTVQPQSSNANVDIAQISPRQDQQGVLACA